MKILCVIDYLGSGGAQRQLVNLAIGFKRRGHDVSFLVYHSHTFYKNTLKQNDIEINEIIESNYIYRVIKFRRFIREGRFDSVLSFLDASNFMCTISGFPARKWKLVVGERSSNPKMSRSIKSVTFKLFHLFSDYVVANSSANIQMVKRINPFLSKTKCKVIYNSVNFDKWKPDTNYTPMKNGKLKLVVMASHRYLKNLNGLVEAVKLLSGNDKAKLLIEWYGDEQDNSKTESIRMIEKYNLQYIFHFYPAREDVYIKVRNADVVGLFSYYEGLPNAICEGMAAGKIVISSDVSDIKNIIKDETMIFNANEPEQLKNLLTRIIHMESNDLITKGKINRERALQLFDNKNIIDEYINLLTVKRNNAFNKNNRQ